MVFKKEIYNKLNNKCKTYIDNKQFSEDLILKINDENFMYQKRRILYLNMVLNHFNIPLDISGIIINYALNNMEIEKNIYKLLPDEFYSKIYDIEILGKNYERVISRSSKSNIRKFVDNSIRKVYKYDSYDYY